MARYLETIGRVWKLLKRTQVQENFLKIQFGINISEKNNTLYMKMRKVASIVLVPNPPPFGPHCVKI